MPYISTFLCLNYQQEVSSFSSLRNLGIDPGYHFERCHTREISQIIDNLFIGTHNSFTIFSCFLYTYKKMLKTKTPAPLLDAK